MWTARAHSAPLAPVAALTALFPLPLLSLALPRVLRGTVAPRWAPGPALPVLAVSTCGVGRPSGAPPLQHHNHLADRQLTNDTSCMLTKKLVPLARGQTSSSVAQVPAFVCMYAEQNKRIYNEHQMQPGAQSSWLECDTEGRTGSEVHCISPSWLCCTLGSRPPRKRARMRGRLNLGADIRRSPGAAATHAADSTENVMHEQLGNVEQQESGHWVELPTDRIASSCLRAWRSLNLLVRAKQRPRQPRDWRVHEQP